MKLKLYFHAVISVRMCFSVNSWTYYYTVFINYTCQMQLVKT